VKGRRRFLDPAEQEAQEIFAKAKAEREARAARLAKMRDQHSGADRAEERGTYLDREMRNVRRP
jgi:hypothetical protein